MQVNDKNQDREIIEIPEHEIEEIEHGTHQLKSKERRAVKTGKVAKYERALSPVIAGLIIDAADFATLGPAGLYLGMVVGFIAAYWVCSTYKFSRNKKIMLSLLTGVYCTMPFTSFIPAATLIGLYIKFNEATESR